MTRDTATGSVSGSFTSFDDETGQTIIQLIPEGLTEAAYEATPTGNTGSYSINNAAPDTHTMKVMKKNHVMRECTVTIGSEAVTQDVKICLIGDLSGDGKINSRDVDRLFAHVKKTALLW